MGDRISIKFVNGREASPTLFSHWGGMTFLRQAKEYVTELKQWSANRNGRMIEPIDRFSPETVMVDFIRHITKDVERVTSDLYILCNPEDGDDSDNGHHEIDLAEPTKK